MKYLILIIFAILACSLFLFQSKGNLNSFTAYKEQYGKVYETKEIEEYRMAIFYENVQKIEAHNATPGITHWEGINQFTDITDEEFQITYLGAIPPEYYENIPMEEETIVNDSNDVDWEKQGGVTPVKNQGSCGSCWAFSAIGSVESMYLVKSKKSTNLSEQQLVDCSKSYGNNGCGGGWPEKALRYIKDKGITTGSDYPYVARDQQCKKEGGSNKISSISSANGCSGLQSAVGKQPISVAVDASNWKSYSGGVFSNCGTRLNHAVLLVGFSSGEKYWKIKNSWGGWGERGYIRLSFPSSTCGVCNACVYPN